MGMSPRLADGVLFGASYYWEYQPPEFASPERLAEDFELMSRAGFTFIRVGESVWSTWEPQDGVFNLDWMQTVLDTAHAHGISVVLGTPTYAVPPWLARTYPEIAGEAATGQRIAWGARQEIDFTHAAFRFHAERVIRAILARYAQHPAIIGFQVDNEPGSHLLHNHNVFQRFVDHLRHWYGTVDALNEAWGLVYWSHRLSDWSDLWRPDGNAQPQYEIAWRDFQGIQTAEFIGWQAGIVREYAADTQFVTTDIAYERVTADDEKISRALDITAGNAYYDMQDSLQLPSAEVAAQSWTTSGVWALQFTGDRMFASRQAPFLITETNAANIGMPWHNRPPYDGQLRQAGWALVARGARAVAYWPWHTLHFGAETHWGGVLPHSERPGRTYREIAALGAEFAQAGPTVAGLVPDADVVMLYDGPSKWLMESHSPLADPDGEQNPRSYHDLLAAFYRGTFDARLSTRLLHARHVLEATPATSTLDPAEFAAAQPLLVAAGLYLADTRLLRWLERYAAAGGHLLLGPRTGYADPEGRARPEVAPPVLSAAAGVWYDEYSNLREPLPVRGTGALGLGDDATAILWLDALQADDAEVLATYDHPHFGQWAAVTSRAHGAGRITCVGAVPGPALARAVFEWARPRPARWNDLPDSVTVTSATNPDGRRVHIVHNWSFDAAPVTVPGPVSDVLSGDTLDAAGPVTLGPWDVRVFAE